MTKKPAAKGKGGHKKSKNPGNKSARKSAQRKTYPLRSPKILGLDPTVYEPVVSKYVVLRERNTNFLDGKLSKSYLTDVEQVHEFLTDDVGLPLDDKSKILAIAIHQLIHQENRRSGILDMRLNVAFKLQQGIHETMTAIELFQANALNVEGVKFIVKRKPFAKGKFNSSPKDFERTKDPKTLTAVQGLEVVNMVMASLAKKKSEFEEMLRLQKENEKLRKKYPAKESLGRTRIASRLSKPIYSFLLVEMRMKKADGIHTTAKILEAFGLMPNLENLNSKKQKKRMYDVCRKYIKS